MSDSFIDDRFPRVTNADGSIKSSHYWVREQTLVKRLAAIGSRATILCDITKDEETIGGAGSVVTEDVPSGMVVAFNPARIVRKIQGG